MHCARYCGWPDGRWGSSSVILEDLMFVYARCFLLRVKFVADMYVCLFVISTSGTDGDMCFGGAGYSWLFNVTCATLAGPGTCNGNCWSTISGPTPGSRAYPTLAPGPNTTQAVLYGGVCPGTAAEHDVWLLDINGLPMQDGSLLFQLFMVVLSILGLVLLAMLARCVAHVCCQLRRRRAQTDDERRPLLHTDSQLALPPPVPAGPPPMLLLLPSPATAPCIAYALQSEWSALFGTRPLGALLPLSNSGSPVAATTVFGTAAAAAAVGAYGSTGPVTAMPSPVRTSAGASLYGSARSNSTVNTATAAGGGGSGGGGFAARVALARNSAQRIRVYSPLDPFDMLLPPMDGVLAQPPPPSHDYDSDAAAATTVPTAAASAVATPTSPAVVASSPPPAAPAAVAAAPAETDTDDARAPLLSSVNMYGSIQVDVPAAAAPRMVVHSARRSRRPPLAPTATSTTSATSGVTSATAASAQDAV